jgi:hypothetical protein
MFWKIASAVPLYQSLLSLCWAGSSSMNSLEATLEERPAALQVVYQPVRLVLGRDADAADARVEAVGEREIDDAEFPAEGDGGPWLATR